MAAVVNFIILVLTIRALARADGSLGRSVAGWLAVTVLVASSYISINIYAPHYFERHSLSGTISSGDNTWVIYSALVFVELIIITFFLISPFVLGLATLINSERKKRSMAATSNSIQTLVSEITSERKNQSAGFMASVYGTLIKFQTFDGRSGRQEFWYWVALSLIVYIVVVMLDAALFDKRGYLRAVYLLSMLLPTIALNCRRLHDHNKSGWLQLLYIIPLAGFVFWLLSVHPGTPGDNRFGADPLVKSATDA